jgi:ubiquinone/menaquinone biosynthesis C-methylase UbiE
MNADAASTVDRNLENKHRTLWGLGDYAAVAAELVAPLGPELVSAAGIGPGVRVLDIAAGTGNVAIAAAQSGADVVASDLVPALLAQGQRRAAAAGVGLVWSEANAEALPFTDGEFDTVVSCIGVMFAPHHQQAADELLRVCRAGGTIGIISWTPEGFIGQMFATMRPFVPAPPPGVSPPPLWGSEQHVADLLGDRVSGVAMTRRRLTVDRFTDGAAFRDYFKANYGPTIAAYRGIADQPERVAELDSALAALGDHELAGTTEMEWEYLLLTARRN